MNEGVKIRDLRHTSTKKLIIGTDSNSTWSFHVEICEVYHFNGRSLDRVVSFWYVPNEGTIDYKLYLFPT